MATQTSLTHNSRPYPSPHLSPPDGRIKQKKHGRIIKIDEADPKLKKLRASYGDALADLVLEKRQEIEEHNPSGHYPIKKLWKNGREMTLKEAITSVLLANQLDEDEDCLDLR